MKKNTMMRLASVLLICVLLTTSTISGTFAKYVTDGSGEDYARVAKWGVTVTSDGVTFDKNYEGTDATKAAISHDNSVESSDEWKVVAPGTTKNATEFSFEGAPEVAYKVDFEITNLALNENWSVDGIEYCPIIFTVEGEKYYIGKDTTITDKATLIKAVKDAVVAVSDSYKPNTPLSSVDVPSVSWEWEFEADTLAGYQSDPKDTALGNKAAAGAAATIELSVKCTVTQLD
ncbi:MAG: hypothetical protein IJ412_05060 [Oscillospiraceae bacterium]|nr:hypothetical protein [Oscillospiraceae bacterium]